MNAIMIFPTLPPALDGIGDYTALLATELAIGHYCVRRVVVITGDRAATDAHHIERVVIRGAFDPEKPRTNLRLPGVIAAEEADWVMLQYNPFSYGRRGLNLHLPRAMAEVRRQSPRTRIAIMFHEVYVPIENWKFAIMTVWQRWQFWRLGQVADVMFFSTGAYAERGRRLFPTKRTVHLPVGSNINPVEISASDARARLGIAPEEVVLGVFGMAHVSRSFTAVTAAAEAVRKAGLRARVLYIGPAGDFVRGVLSPEDKKTAIVQGPLASDEVSRRLAAVDIALSTYTDGVSTRRGGMMAALQHGLCVLGTDGHCTDLELRNENGRAMILVRAADDVAFAAAAKELALDRNKRMEIGKSGRALYERRYSWPSIAKTMMSHLRLHPGKAADGAAAPVDFPESVRIVRETR